MQRALSRTGCPVSYPFTILYYTTRSNHHPSVPISFRNEISISSRDCARSNHHPSVPISFRNEISISSRDCARSNHHLIHSTSATKFIHSAPTGVRCRPSHLHRVPIFPKARPHTTTNVDFCAIFINHARSPVRLPCPSSLSPGTRRVPARRPRNPPLAPVFHSACLEPRP